MPTRRQLLSLSIAALCGALALPAFTQTGLAQSGYQPPPKSVHPPKGGKPPPPVAAANDPLAITDAIYKRVSAGKGDEGGNFVTLNHRDRQRYLSRSLAALWKKADDATPKGDQNPPGFDPITNSQDPMVRSFEARVETQDDTAATIAVTMDRTFPGQKPEPSGDDTVRLDFVRDGSQWKIDNFRGTVDGKPWSIRRILTNSLN